MGRIAEGRKGRSGGISGRRFAREPRASGPFPALNLLRMKQRFRSAAFAGNFPT
jgi:hypothetical protein